MSEKSSYMNGAPKRSNPYMNGTPKRSEPFVNGSGVVDFYKVMPNEFLKGDETKNDYPNYKECKIDVPFRMLIVGASGSRKTSSMMHIITKINAWMRIMVFTKQTDEPLYKFLQDRFQKIEKKLNLEEGTLFTISDDLKQVPSVDSLDPEIPSLIIFDDMVLEKKQTEVEQYFLRARKMNCSCIYITQAYHLTKKFIRSQCDLIAFKRINSVKDLSLVLSEYKLTEDKDQLKAMYKYSIKDPLDWFLVDLKTSDPNLRFRHNFKGFREENVEAHES